MASRKTLSDNELLQLLKQSDHSAYTEIYNRYFQLIYVHVYKKLQDEDQSKDIVQEIFASLWFKRDSIGFIGNIPGYLINAARYKIFDLFAHEQVKQKHYESLQEFLTSRPVISTDYQIREAQFKAYIDQQIAALPPKMRVIFEMSRKEELNHQEIADRLSTSVNNVSTQVTNALRILRSKLGLLILTLMIIYHL